jgi:hypothetical protein
VTWRRVTDPPGAWGFVVTIQPYIHPQVLVNRQKIFGAHKIILMNAVFGFCHKDAATGKFLRNNRTAMMGESDGGTECTRPAKRNISQEEAVDNGCSGICKRLGTHNG